MTTHTYTRDAAVARALDCVTVPPLNLRSDDAASVVHVVGPCEDLYLALGGAYTPERLQEFYAGTPHYSATLVAVFYREGQSCADACKEFAVDVLE